MFSLTKSTNANLPLIGVGLRHPHYQDALDTPANIDFVEVHAENFFAHGGASKALLTDIVQHYQLSLHATSLGLGSAIAPPIKQLTQLAELVEQFQPLMVSDHACFAWADSANSHLHAGDLLPIPFNEQSLQAMAANVNRVQQQLGRTLLVENLSAYLQLEGTTMHEAEFLVQLSQKTGCKLLIDVNNLLVNAVNQPLLQQQTSHLAEQDYLIQAQQWLDKIPTDTVGEIHLAGCTPVSQGQMMIDDHSQPVSELVWQLYRYALTKFGAVATLIEWDEDLPTWHTLVAEAEKARAIAHEVLQ